VEEWLRQLKFDPLPQLLSSENKAIVVFTKRDLLEEKVASVETLWGLPFVTRAIGKQQKDGSWKYPGGKPDVRSRQNYNQLETYRILGELVEKYGLKNSNPSIEKAASFLFGFQTEEGDFRGIYGNQYTPNYTAGIMEILVKAGYEEDPRIEKGFRWLLSIRQRDGGWAIPLRTKKAKLDAIAMSRKTIQPDKSKPFSHLVTGVVLRAFAAHKIYRESVEAKTAGKLLASRFFNRDLYPDRGTIEFWTKFTFPFWFTDLLSSLDSLSLLRFTTNDPHVKKAVDWLVAKQQKIGSWNLTILKGKDKEVNRWMSLAICRVIKRFHKDSP
jgi:hypothetical protein